MKEPIELPKFWFKPLDEWDTAIMAGFPYVCCLSRANLRNHYEITQEVRELLGENVSWRGPMFYFKKQEDAIMFRLKWS